MSFFLTQVQMLNQTKSVTRRLGWEFLEPGELLQPVVKAQGLKKGEKMKKIGCPIKVIDVRREPLNNITYADVLKEGFRVTPAEFIEMFLQAHKKTDPTIVITRIAFEFTEE